MLETGIKVIDVFAPITKGGTVRVFARHGMGQIVVLLELIFRMKQEGFVTVLLKSEGDYSEFIDIEKEMEYICQNAEEVKTLIKEIGSEKEVLLFTGHASVNSDEWNETLNIIKENVVHSLTTILIDLDGDSNILEIAPVPLLTEWHFDAKLAQRYIYPAINPIKSCSNQTGNYTLEQDEQLSKDQAYKLLCQYQELRLKLNSQGITELDGNDRLMYKRGEMIEAYLTQPFFVAETFTGQKGQFVPLKQALKDIKRIIDGVEDEREVEQLKFIGSL